MEAVAVVIHRDYFPESKHIKLSEESPKVGEILSGREIVELLVGLNHLKNLLLVFGLMEQFVPKVE